MFVMYQKKDVTLILIYIVAVNLNKVKSIIDSSLSIMIKLIVYSNLTVYACKQWL